MVEAIRNQGGRIVAIRGQHRRTPAEAFARDFDIPQAIEGYVGVINHPDVEAVYLPLINTLHFEWALACARAGKHCLCEKPLVLLLREARELRWAFAGAGRRLVEAFMWRHNPHTAETLRLAQGGELGELRRFHAMHGYGRTLSAGRATATKTCRGQGCSGTSAPIWSTRHGFSSARSPSPFPARTQPVRPARVG